MYSYQSKQQGENCCSIDCRSAQPALFIEEPRAASSKSDAQSNNNKI